VPRDFQRLHVKDTIQGVRDIIDSLPVVMDPHAEYVLLRSCFALSNVMSQHSISLEVDLSLKASCDQEAVTIRDKARIRSLAVPYTADWLNVVPLLVLGLHLKPREFKFAVAYLLGIQIYQKERTCPACKRACNKFEDHSVACAYTAECIARHNHLRDAVLKVAYAAALAPTKEKNALIPGTNGRPADVLVRAWGHGGKDMAFDIVVTSPLQSALVNRAAREDRWAAKKAYEDKLRRYGEDCARNGMEMAPLATDTFGGWHPKSAIQLKRLAKALAK
jgi:hypothetical protein